MAIGILPVDVLPPERLGHLHAAPARDDESFDPTDDVDWEEGAPYDQWYVRDPTGWLVLRDDGRYRYTLHGDATEKEELWMALPAVSVDGAASEATGR